MSLTKEDLLAIHEIVTKVVDDKIEPLAKDVAAIKEDVSSFQKGFRQFVDAQVKFVVNVEQMEGSIKFLLSHVNLSSDNRDLRKTFQDIERELKAS